MPALAADHVVDAAPTPADAARVLGLIGGYQVSQAIYAAAQLKLSDLIAAGVVTSDELAEHAGAVPDRSEAEFAALLGGAGFTLVEVAQMAAPTSLIEARPV
jgi:hypothetical protein